MPSLAEVVAALERRWPPSGAEAWDAVGPVCGDPDAPVRRVLFAMDPVEAVIDEAVAWSADLLVTHHPLFLRGTSSVYAGGVKGRVVHRLLTAGCGLFVAHTNADAAPGGVADVLAETIGLVDVRPLLPSAGTPVDKLTVYVPVADADGLVDALAAAGAGAIGAYDRCAYWTDGTGTFRPLDGAHPAIGRVGAVEQVAERRIEMVLPRARRAQVVAALRATHPYEEPAFDLVETAGELSGAAGQGRVGRLPRPMRLGEFGQQVADRLPATAVGVRIGGDLDRLVETVAVSGGAGDAYLADVAAAAVHAYVTADLRHHPASEHLEGGGPGLVDPGHWASEWPWLARAAADLGRALEAVGATVDLRVSTLVTDPWTAHATRRSTP